MNTISTKQLTSFFEDLKTLVDSTLTPTDVSQPAKTAQPQIAGDLDQFTLNAIVEDRKSKILFKDFVAAFKEWLPADRRERWTKIAIRRALVLRAYTIQHSTGNKRYITGVKWRAGWGPYIPAI